MAKIKSVAYNGHQVGNLNDGLEYDYDYAQVGKPERVTKRIPENIKESGLGSSTHYVTISYLNGETKKVFNINSIDYESEVRNEPSKMAYKFIGSKLNEKIIVEAFSYSEAEEKAEKYFNESRKTISFRGQESI